LLILAAVIDLILHLKRGLLKVHNMAFNRLPEPSGSNSLFSTLLPRHRHRAVLDINKCTKIFDFH
jgi:hypothetical protein